MPAKGPLVLPEPVYRTAHSVCAGLLGMRFWGLLRPGLAEHFVASKLEAQSAGTAVVCKLHLSTRQAEQGCSLAICTAQAKVCMLQICAHLLAQPQAAHVAGLAGSGTQAAAGPQGSL